MAVSARLPGGRVSGPASARPVSGTDAGSCATSARRWYELDPVTAQIVKLCSRM
jgi:hypothetical protein